MGKPKNRNSDFFRDHPFCCFCGGTTPATTIDHVPSTQTFLQRRRPKGLEVPACKKCNNSTGAHEQVAAFLARLYPNKPYNKLDIKEFGKITKAIAKNNPELLEELVPSWQQQYDYVNLNLPGKPLYANGPLLNKSIQIFGRKLCQALHYAHTNKIVPTTGGIYVRWYSNYNRMTGNMPDWWINRFPSPKTLEQGKRNVCDQFQYSLMITEDKTQGGYFATFQKSFAILGLVLLERDPLLELEDTKVHIPGEPFNWE